MITVNGIKVLMKNENDERGTFTSASWQMIINDFEKNYMSNGCKVDAIVIDPDYGLLFRLK